MRGLGVDPTIPGHTEYYNDIAWKTGEVFIGAKGLLTITSNYIRKNILRGVARGILQGV